MQQVLIHSYHYSIYTLVNVEMPLASNEEWKARIGSSWCALGVPFKIRSQRCSPSGKSSGAVTHLLISSMTMLLIQFVWLNVTFSEWKVSSHDTHVHVPTSNSKIGMLLNCYCQ